MYFSSSTVMTIQAHGVTASVNCVALTWTGKLRSSCQIIVEGFELKVMCIFMEFSSSFAKFCCNVPNVGHQRCSVEITELLIFLFFLSFIFPLPFFNIQFKNVHLLRLLLLTAGVTFCPFFQYSPHTNHRVCVVSHVYSQSTQHGLPASNKMSCILATELMYETYIVNPH